MAKRTASIEGWSVTLRVRVQRKKRVQNGRTRGRYEGKTAHVIVLAPDGTRREYYLGSGEHHKQNAGVSPARGEEKRRGAPAAAGDVAGGRKGGKKRARADNDTRDPFDTRTMEMFSEEKGRSIPALRKLLNRR